MVLNKVVKILTSLNLILDRDDHPAIVPKFFDPLLLMLGKYINDALKLSGATVGFEFEFYTDFSFLLKISKRSKSFMIFS